MGGTDERDELLAEAQRLKQDLLKVSAADGKVPPELTERLARVQQRIAETGLATEPASPAKGGGDKSNGGDKSSKIWERMLALLAILVVVAVPELLMWRARDQPTTKKAKKKQK